jgi:hypothetical protein
VDPNAIEVAGSCAKEVQRGADMHEIGMHESLGN